MYDAPKKMDKKKKIELVIVVLLIFWVLAFAIDYYRYTKSEPLIFALKPKPAKYDDGTVTEYLGLGYIYRKYDRNSIKLEEFVPFWVLRKNPKSTDALPETYKDYEVPKNPTHADKYKSLLYFYNEHYELVGTYKCINTERDCVKAFSGYDKYNIQNTEPLMALEEQPIIDLYDGRYGFVDDSISQKEEYGNLQYLRTIYLLDVKENKILATYEDIKFWDYNARDKAEISKHGNAIVKDAKSRKWGIINISKDGKITEVLPDVYDSITYDIDTGYLILCYKGTWSIYDLKNKKKVSNDYTDVIYDVWKNANLTYYIKTGVKRTVGNETRMNYKIYNIDGNALLDKEEVINVYETSTFILYVDYTDKAIHFIDYTGEAKRDPIPIYFFELTHDKTTNPAFSFKLSEYGYMLLKVYKGRELKYDAEEYSFSTKIWN